MTPDTLVKHFGSTAKVAKSMGVTSQTVRNWIKGKKVPFQWQLVAQHETDGKLKASKK